MICPICKSDVQKRIKFYEKFLLVKIFYICERYPTHIKTKRIKFDTLEEYKRWNKSQKPHRVRSLLSYIK